MSNNSPGKEERNPIGHAARVIVSLGWDTVMPGSVGLECRVEFVGQGRAGATASDHAERAASLRRSRGLGHGWRGRGHGRGGSRRGGGRHILAHLRLQESVSAAAGLDPAADLVRTGEWKRQSRAATCMALPPHLHRRGGGGGGPHGARHRRPVEVTRVNGRGGGARLQAAVVAA